MSNNWTAPLKRNWKSGTTQVAGFLRTAQGGTVSICADRATADEQQLVLWLIAGASKMSPELRRRLQAEWDTLKAVG
jgi:hypothetical protein